MIREKKHRLPPEEYRGLVVVSITACIRNRIPFFLTQDRFKVFETMLLDALEKFNYQSEVYLFMPDHMHCILRGSTETSDILRAMRSFKQYSGHWLSVNHPAVRWQKDFYDRILTTELELEDCIWYMLNNPVRGGLVSNWKEYPYRGSSIHNFEEWD